MLPHMKLFLLLFIFDVAVIFFMLIAAALIENERTR
jgi:hypothetical protein